MTSEEIAALAREYAEEIVQDTDSYPELPISLLNEMRKEVAEDFEEKIRFLFRRYCLVEKSKVNTEYKNVAEAVDAKRKWNLTLSEDKLAKADLLFDLFPDLRKEVEGWS